MTTKLFVGRENYIDILLKQNAKSNSTITALYGRRRIGKTSLVEHVFKSHRLLKFEGIENASEQEQRHHFAETLYRYSGQQAHTLLDTSNWTKLLIALSAYISDKPTVVFFDEYQWMSTERTKLTSFLKFVWDNYFTKENHVHLIICGSISSFIVKKVIQSKALYGRIDAFIELKELSLPETLNDFFTSISDRKNILNYYLAMGGIPKYLELFDRKKSFEQNIEFLCFTKGGYFVNEVDRLFVSHFGRNRAYKDIVKFLASRSHATQVEIQKKLSVKSGGRLTTFLEDLEYAGFIDCYTPLNKTDKSNLKRYRLRDPYLRFYFKFIFPNLKKINSTEQPILFSNLVKQSELDIWKGLTYESSIREHHALVAKILGFSAVMYTTGAWYKKNDQQSGYQIDLIFLRKDKIITICEVKYLSKITSKVLIEIKEKEAKLLEELRPDGVQKVLITVDPPDKNFDAQRVFDQVICLEDFLR
jgi:uncharacterized protein